MNLNHHSITRNKDGDILKEKMTSSLFITIENLNMNIIQYNEIINRAITPFPNLVLANRITRIIPIKFKLIVQFKGNH